MKKFFWNLVRKWFKSEIEHERNLAVLSKLVEVGNHHHKVYTDKVQYFSSYNGAKTDDDDLLLAKLKGIAFGESQAWHSSWIYVRDEARKYIQILKTKK